MNKVSLFLSKKTIFIVKLILNFKLKSALLFKIFVYKLSRITERANGMPYCCLESNLIFERD